MAQAAGAMVTLHDASTALHMSVVHASPSSHFGSPGPQAPAPLQWSPTVHASPSSHAVDAGAGDQTAADIDGMHCWHGFIGLESPAL